MQLLIERIARYNDQLAFRQLFLHFCDRLIHFAGTFLSSREEAEEAVSDVFIKLWQHREKLPEIANLQTYLYKAVKNTALNYQARIKHIYTDIDHISVKINAQAPSPEEALISRENLQQIEQAVNRLPPRCKLIFKLVKEDNLSYREVADILDISMTTVNVQMSIALRKLGKAIDLSHPPSFYLSKK